MYGQHANMLPLTGMAGGFLVPVSTGLGLVTVGLITLTLLGMSRRRKHARP